MKDKRSKEFPKNTFSRGNSFLLGHRDFLFRNFLFWNFLFWDFLFRNFLWYFGNFKDRVSIFKTTKSKLGHWTSKIRQMDKNHDILVNNEDERCLDLKEKVYLWLVVPLFSGQEQELSLQEFSLAL